MPYNIIIEMWIARNYANRVSACVKLNRDFNLTLEEYKDLLLSTHCHYTGIELCKPPLSNKGYEDSTKTPRPNQITLERVNPELGYVSGNVVPCAWFVNNMKSSLEGVPEKREKIAKGKGLEEFIQDAKIGLLLAMQGESDGAN